MENNIINTRRYKGMATQDDFNERYLFTKARIALGYTQEEVSFLLGKLSSFYVDFEEMNGNANLSKRDREVLSIIFENISSSYIPFEPDDEGYNVRRLIKVVVEEDMGIIFHRLIHPWQVKNPKTEIKENKPVVFKEIIYQQSVVQKENAILLFRSAVSELIESSYFSAMRLPISIYKQVRKLEYDPALRPAYLKEVLYECIGKDRLRIKNINNQIHYHR